MIDDTVPTSIKDLSMVNFGLIMNGRKDVHLYNPEWFFPNDYGAAVRVLQEKGSSIEDASKVLNPKYLNNAHDSVVRWNGIGEEYDWMKALKTAYESDKMGDKFLKLGKKLKNNEPVEMAYVYSDIQSLLAQESSGLSRLEDISDDYKPFKLSGYEPIDKVLGGIPTDGPIIIFGSSGVGKSKFVSGLITSLLKTYPNETAALYTLEMNSTHWKWRTADLFPKVLEVKDRLYVSGSVKDIDELVAEITIKKVNYVILDDIDSMVKESSPSEFERVFRRIKEVCRFMGIPFFVIAQIAKEKEIAINGTGVGGKSRFLYKTDIAWTSAAEKSAALLLGLQTVMDEVDMSEDAFVKDSQPLDYIIAFKSRDGWLGDRDSRYQVGPGAIVLEHTPNWMGKFYNGKAKLWSRNRTNRIGAK